MPVPAPQQDRGAGRTLGAVKCRRLMISFADTSRDRRFHRGRMPALPHVGRPPLCAHRACCKSRQREVPHPRVTSGRPGSARSGPTAARPVSPTPGRASAGRRRSPPPIPHAPGSDQYPRSARETCRLAHVPCHGTKSPRRHGPGAAVQWATGRSVFGIQDFSRT